jgi:iron transport multicopper oxidase
MIIATLFSSLLLLLSLSPSALAAPQTRVYNWTVTNFTSSFDGVRRYTLGINNNPGHLTGIEINLGDTVVVSVTNALNVPTSIHWHGMRQNGTQEMDGPTGVTQCGIKPGKKVTYKFTPTDAGTYWWHAHYGAQYVDGLRGPLIIRNMNDPHKSKYDEELTIQLTDWYHTQSEILTSNFLNNVVNPDGDEPVWETSLLNGLGTFNCAKTKMACNTTQPVTRFSFVPGKRYRLRLINMAAFAAYDFSIDNHRMRVIEVDGVDVVTSTYINSIKINVAQRYSVIVIADKSNGNYWMRAKSIFGNPWTSLPKAQFPIGFNPMVVASIAYSNMRYASTSQQLVQITDLNDVPQQLVQVLDINDITLVPYVAQNVKLVADTSFLVEFGIYNTISDPVTKAYISINNGSYNSYKVPTVPTLFAVANGTPVSNLPVNSNAISVQSGKLIEIKIINKDPGEHPFHMHGRSFWVVGKGNTANVNDITPVKTINPLRRDTFTVPPCNINANDECIDVGYTTIRFIADNPGVWILHCHIEWHIQSGLTMTIVEGADKLKNKVFASDLVNTCK